MKIAISGLHQEKCREIITEVQKLWPKYVSPTKTIFDEELEPPVDIDEISKQYKRLTKAEKDNFLRWKLLADQFEKYKNQTHIIYCGSPVDMLVNSLVLGANEELKENYVTKTIGYFKSHMKKLDVVYWVPNEDGTDNLDELDTQLEQVYNALYDNYRNHIKESTYFDANDCGAFIRFNTTNYIEEMKLVIDHNGNLFGSDGDDHDLEDTVKIEGLLKKNPKALQALLQGQDDRKSGYLQIK